MERQCDATAVEADLEVANSPAKKTVLADKRTVLLGRFASELLRRHTEARRAGLGGICVADRALGLAVRGGFVLTQSLNLCVLALRTLYTLAL